MKTIKAKHKAVYEPIADLVTYRAMPTRLMPMNALDPFIFLNHHGWQQYAPNNNGLPFGPHPHRGFETVTFIIEGDLTHKDSSGQQSIIKAGGVQWMTAGRGLVHAEISSDTFKEKGGPLEILQLWINLPSKFKMTPPAYTGLQKEEIPVQKWDDGKVQAQIIAGNWDGVIGPVKPLTDVHLACIAFTAGGRVTFSIEKNKTVFLYVVKGSTRINGEEAAMHHLVEFSHEGSSIEMKALSDALVLFGHATPFHEPFAAYGPFVMNTQEEIMHAYEDYHAGKFGTVS
ncbi:pirin family protein [Panacibacter sp. DH6]|uniref:Pirin family protein n=1 Tax=Panacibacter microcysteis TaxID=2793269 RepID=A0A931E0F9_9BACT|nr:pirin family protein [Panacibacter microcysteis]MBG9376342.1 pirin family protein [Panacibacter microcysteis]